MKAAEGTDCLGIAETFSRAFHQFHKRHDGTTPYMDHVQEVAVSLSRHNYAWEVISTAYLHDILEMCSPTTDLETLRGIRMPESVVMAVSVLTRNPNDTYAAYIEKVNENEIARRVKIADILSNIGTVEKYSMIQRYSKALLVLTLE